MMSKEQYFKVRLYITGIVALAIGSLLAWNNFHGGIPKHHILARKDLPEISNVWGGILLPLLTWFLLYRIQQRVLKEKDMHPESADLPLFILYRFASSLLFGILLSVFFTFDYMEIPGYMLMGALILSVFIPLYRSEYILGFVMGMTYTFGAVLPTLIGSVLAIIAFLLYILFRRPILFIRSKMAHFVSSQKDTKDG
jgi:hypothetical protein